MGVGVMRGAGLGVSLMGSVMRGLWRRLFRRSFWLMMSDRWRRLAVLKAGSTGAPHRSGPVRPVRGDGCKARLVIRYVMTMTMYRIRASVRG